MPEEKNFFDLSHREKWSILAQTLNLDFSAKEDYRYSLRGETHDPDGFDGLGMRLIVTKLRKKDDVFLFNQAFRDLLQRKGFSPDVKISIDKPEYIFLNIEEHTLFEISNTYDPSQSAVFDCFYNHTVSNDLKTHHMDCLVVSQLTES